MTMRLGLALALAAVGIAVSSTAHATDWVLCGKVSQISTTTCELAGRPLTQWEYGIAYNSREPVPVLCNNWNVGWRIINKQPYFVYSDNPPVGTRYGGFVFYAGTNAADDDGRCRWRHKYWRLGVNNQIEVLGPGNGCYNGTPIDRDVYCRRQ